MLREGDQVDTSIKVLNSKGEVTSLGDFLGNYVVLYFYPKDQTPGCTIEACSFRDLNKEIQKLGAKVIGVSADSVESHKKFIEKHDLSFDLWSDFDKKLLRHFGTLVEKSMFGKKYVGIARATFIISKDGTIMKIWPKVRPDNHAMEVLEFLQNLIS